MKDEQHDSSMTFNVMSFNTTTEGLQGVVGNKGAWPFTFGEQGNISFKIYILRNIGK